jgi:hypothetical protein
MGLVSIPQEMIRVGVIWIQMGPSPARIQRRQVVDHEGYPGAGFDVA